MAFGFYPWWLEKFSGNVGVVTFPLAQYEYTPDQNYRVAEARAVGADYAHDFAGRSPWAKDPGVESVRFLIVGQGGVPYDGGQVNTIYNDIVYKCRQGGLGQLWRIQNSQLPETRQWCWAKLDSRPGFSSKTDSPGMTAVTMRFRRYSDWYAESSNVLSHTFTASGQTWVFSQAGNAPIKNATLRFRANTSAGINHPVLANTTNGYSIGSNRVSASVNDEWKVDAGRYSSQWSTNDGASYVDDYANIVLGATQVGFFQIEPGSNTLLFTSAGSPNLTVDLVANDAYE